MGRGVGRGVGVGRCGGVLSPMPRCQHGSQELLSSDSLLPKGKTQNNHHLGSLRKKEPGNRLDFKVVQS